MYQLEKAQGLGRKKTTPYSLICLWLHTEAPTPEGATVSGRTGAHFMPMPGTAYALTAYGPHSSPVTLRPVCMFRSNLSRQGSQTPEPEGALRITAGTDEFG